MDKVRVGLPNAFINYYFNHLLEAYLKELNIEVIKSPRTNKTIIDNGNNLATDEMCLPMKIYLGHIDYLKDKCDYIVIPRVASYGLYEQTCTNFMAIYDIVNNLFDINILQINIDLMRKKDEFDSFFDIGITLGKKNHEIIKAYMKAKEYEKNYRKQIISYNYRKLISKQKKILIVSHPYNIYDYSIGIPILKYLKELKIEFLLSTEFDSEKASKASKFLSSGLYFKYAKENIGAIMLSKRYIDGIIFLSSFPCGIDSLVNELIMRKINIPFINLVVDDMDAEAGIKTRLESFVDILEQV